MKTAMQPKPLDSSIWSQLSDQISKWVSLGKPANGLTALEKNIAQCLDVSSKGELGPDYTLNHLESEAHPIFIEMTLNTLPQIINTEDQLIRILTPLNAQLRKAVFDAIKPNICHIFQQGDKLAQVIPLLSEGQVNALLRKLEVHLPKRLTTLKAFESLIFSNHLTMTQKVFICLSLHTTLSSLINHKINLSYFFRGFRSQPSFQGALVHILQENIMALAHKKELIGLLKSLNTEAQKRLWTLLNDKFPELNPIEESQFIQFLTTENTGIKEWKTLAHLYGIAILGSEDWKKLSLMLLTSKNKLEKDRGLLNMLKQPDSVHTTNALYFLLRCTDTVQQKAILKAFQSASHPLRFVPQISQLVELLNCLQPKEQQSLIGLFEDQLPKIISNKAERLQLKKSGLNQALQNDILSKLSDTSPKKPTGVLFVSKQTILPRLAIEDKESDTNGGKKRKRV